MALNVDLSIVPTPVDEVIPAGIDVTLRLGLPRGSGEVRTQTPAVEESNDDDNVVVISPESFEEARRKARRNRELIEVFDADTDFQHAVPIRSWLINSPDRLRRASPDSTIGVGRWIATEISERRKSKSVAEALVLLQNVPAISLPPPKPPTPTFNCVVCMGPFVEETTTKCGHIFCKECILKAIAAQGKCPTCRRKMKKKDTLRVYLPTPQ